VISDLKSINSSASILFFVFEKGHHRRYSITSKYQLMDLKLADGVAFLSIDGLALVLILIHLMRSRFISR
jgi:hypothetical protein